MLTPSFLENPWGTQSAARLPPGSQDFIDQWSIASWSDYSLGQEKKLLPKPLLSVASVQLASKSLHSRDGGSYVLSIAFSQTVYTCSIPFMVSLQNASTSLPVQLFFEHWSGCDWSAFNSQLILQQLRTPSLYIAIVLTSGRGRIYSLQIHLISQTRMMCIGMWESWQDW